MRDRFSPLNHKTMKNPLTLWILLLIGINAGAQVGIGTVSPLSTLDVRGSFSGNTRSFTGNTSASSTDYTLVFTGSSASALTLPDATTCTGRVYLIKNASTSGTIPVLTVGTTSSQTIDGITTYLLNSSYQSVEVVSNGSNWNALAQNTSAAAGTSWTLGGNTVGALQNLGTISNYDLPFITDNTEGMRLSAAGNLGVGTSTFNATNPEKLVVNAGTTSSVNAIVGRGSLNNYFQLNIQNQNSGSNASSDVVATADNGTESTNYVDLGINSSTYNTSAITGGVNNAYLYSAANDFVMGNSTAGKNLIFFTGGTAASNEAMRINPTGKVGVANTNPQATLDVDGTVKVGTAGTILNSIIRFTDQSITDNTTFTYNQSRTETFTLSGVTQYASIIVTPRSALPVGLGIAFAYASATNTVSVGIINASGATLALGTVAFDITVIQ
jgi:hypothetical protein